MIPDTTPNLARRAPGDSLYNNTRPCVEMLSTGVTLQPEPDVSGPGILAAFIFCAYAAFLVTLGSYVSGHLDAGLLRPVDTLVHRVPSYPGKKRGRKVIQRFILLLSDQQIVTGIAMLISGFLAMSRKDDHSIDTYHFQIVIYLAWMASSVNMSALTALSGHLNEHRAVMGWRLAGMTLLTLMLLVALFPTASNLWGFLKPTGADIDGPTDPEQHLEWEEALGWGVPARCFFFQNHGMGINNDAPMAIVLLLASFIWKVSNLFQTSRTFYTRWIRGPFEHVLEQSLHKQALSSRRTGSGGTRLGYRLTMAAYVWVMSQNELLHSFAASLHLSWIGIVFGSIQIFVPRKQTAYLFEGEEDHWNFGQIVPLVLLLLPLGILLEHWKPGAFTSRSRNHSLQVEKNENGKMPNIYVQDMLERQPSEATTRSAPGREQVSDVFASQTITRIAERPTQPLDCHLVLFTSRVFQLLIILTELGITATVVAVLWRDTSYIGETWTDGVILRYVLIGIASVIALTLGVAFAAIPFSRLYK